MKNCSKICSLELRQKLLLYVISDDIACKYRIILNTVGIWKAIHFLINANKIV